MNLIESLLGLITKEDKPLHVGEVMSVWQIMVAFEEGHSMITGLLNHTADPELKRYMESYVSDFEEPWSTRLTEFMKNEGITLPPGGTAKPKANERDIPSGGKFTDPEIAALLAGKVRTGTALVQAGLLDCLNYRLARILIELEVAAYRQAFVLRELMEKRGWMRQPPAWNGRSRPAGE